MSKDPVLTGHLPSLLAIQASLTERLSVPFHWLLVFALSLTNSSLVVLRLAWLPPLGIRETQVWPRFSVPGLWPMHTHSDTLKSCCLRRCSVSINQYCNSHSHFHPLPQKLVALFMDQGDCSEVLRVISGENSVEGQDVNWAENTHIHCKTTSF